jgi:NAD+ kinase
MAKVRAVAIITKKKSEDAKAAAEKISKMLRSAGVDTFAISPLNIDGCDTIEPEQAKGRADLILAIGGDGTTLKAFRTIPGNIPLLSINVGGHRGILSEVYTSNTESAVK